MDRIGLAGLFVLAMGCGPSTNPEPHAASTSSDDTDRYVSKEGSFSVVFPATPETSSRNVETEFGTITLQETGVAVTTPGALGAFTVTYADLPFSGKLRMVDVTRELVRKSPRIFVSEKEIDIVPGALKGWELVYEEDGIEKTGRVFEVGPRYYQLLVEYPKGAKPPGMHRFFESFRLL
ncbi:MAG: hypothetical protein ACXVEF_43165 [Polyangiales bacterium]